MQKILDSCLEDLAFILIENVQWISEATAPENEVQAVENEEEYVIDEATASRKSSTACYK